MMFGKKKDEEWEYIEQYFQKDNYGQVADEEYWHKEHTSTEYLTEIFKPYLMEGEQILCVIGGGKGKTNDLFESGKGQRRIRALIIFGEIYSAIIVISFILSAVLVKIKVWTSFVDYMILLPVAIVIGVFLAAVILAVTVGEKGVNHAITDRRIISHGYGDITVISFAYITSVSANTNSITVRASMFEGERTNLNYFISGVKDPPRVKYIIDQAVEKYKAGGVQDD